MAFGRIMHKTKGWMMRHVHLMITCEELESFILDYLDGHLSARQRFVFDLHMKMCKECRAYLSAYQRTIALGKAAFGDPAAPVPDDVPEDLVRAILEARGARD